MTIRTGLLFILLVLPLLSNTGAEPAEIDPDYHKTVILFKLLQFVSFPHAADDEIKLTCFGDDSLIESIDGLARTYLVSGRRIVIVRVTTLKEFWNLGHTDIVYISSREKSRLMGILEEARRRRILSISNGEGFAEKGVHINLYTFENKVNFEVNRREVEKSGLYLSSRLYKLARIIE